jgi:hypothetical protein
MQRLEAKASGIATLRGVQIEAVQFRDAKGGQTKV